MRNDIFHADPNIHPDGLAFPTLFNELDAISGGVSDITPELALKVGAASAQIASRIAVGYSDCGICTLLANAFIAGAGSVGAKVTDTDAGVYSVATYLARNYLFNLTVFMENDNGKLRIRMCDKYGLAPERDLQKKIELHTASRRAVRTGIPDTACPKRITGTRDAFALSSAKYGKSTGFEVSVTGKNEASRILRYALSLSGCNIVPQRRGTLMLSVSDDGTLLRLRDEREQWYDDGHVTAMLALVHFSNGEKELAVNASAPSVVEQIAARFDGRIMRIGRDCGAREVFLKQNILTDAISSAVCLCSYLSETGTYLYELAEKLPEFTLVSREVNVFGNRREALSRIAKKISGMHTEDTGELRVCTDGGWVNIAPSRSRTALRITGEAMNEEIASELCDLFVTKARSLDEKQQK